MMATLSRHAMYQLFLLAAGLTYYCYAQQYIGCYIDGSPAFNSKDRAFRYGHEVQIILNTVRSCAELCVDKDYLYAGLQAGSWCYCANYSSYYRYGKASEDDCSTPCSGDSGQICGGGWRNSVYTTGLSTVSNSAVFRRTSSLPAEVPELPLYYITNLTSVSNKVACLSICSQTNGCAAFKLETSCSLLGEGYGYRMPVSSAIYIRV